MPHSESIVLRTHVPPGSPGWRGWLYHWWPWSLCCCTWGHVTWEAASTPPPPTTGLPLALTSRWPFGVWWTAAWRNPACGDPAGRSDLREDVHEFVFAIVSLLVTSLQRGGVNVHRQGLISPNSLYCIGRMWGWNKPELTYFHPRGHFGLWSLGTPDELWQQRMNDPAGQNRSLIPSDKPQRHVYLDNTFNVFYNNTNVFWHFSSRKWELKNSLFFSELTRSLSHTVCISIQGFIHFDC